MSLYNMFHGFNLLAGWILDHLNLTRKDLGRFRDASLFKDEKEGYVIRILTRNAGSREHYRATDEKLAEHPMFLRTEIEESDNTYKYFFFKMPKTMTDEFLEHGVRSEASSEELDVFVDNRSLREKTDQVIAAIQARTT